MPNLELYDGTTDPEEHLRVYKTQMYIQDVDDAAYYRYFPATLKGVTQKWFSGLPPGNVTCFQKLSDHFVSAFIAVTRNGECVSTFSKLSKAQ